MIPSISKMTIGKKIRELRLQKDWTLADLAKHSGVALSSLSRMETGKMTGTLESHIRIVRALGVRLPELYADLDPLNGSIEHRTKTQQMDKLIAGKGACSTILASGSLRKKMLPAMVHIPQGRTTQHEQAPVGVETFIYLLKGRVEAAVGKERILLNVGDSLYFQASIPHQLKSMGPGAALAVKVTSPPSL